MNGDVLPTGRDLLRLLAMYTLVPLAGGVIFVIVIAFVAYPMLREILASFVAGNIVGIAVWRRIPYDGRAKAALRHVFHQHA